MQTKTYETEYCGKKLKAEISDLADQANGSVFGPLRRDGCFRHGLHIQKQKRRDRLFSLDR